MWLRKLGLYFEIYRSNFGNILLVTSQVSTRLCKKGDVGVRIRTFFPMLVVMAALFLAQGICCPIGGLIKESRRANDHSCCPAISANGRYVAFVSWATNLVDDDNNGNPDIFVRDLQTEKIVRVSVAPDGREGDGECCRGMSLFCDEPSISASGRYVAFSSASTNLVEGDSNGMCDAFIHDRDIDEDGIFDERGAVDTIRVSVTSDGAQLNNEVIGPPSMSDDGRYVAFAYASRGTDPGIDVEGSHILVHDMVTGETIVASLGFSEDDSFEYVLISSDGRYVLLIPYYLSTDEQISYIRDLWTDETNSVKFSVDNHGYGEWECAWTEDSCAEPGMILEGRCVTFNQCNSSDGGFVAFIQYNEAPLNLLESRLDHWCDEFFIPPPCDYPDVVSVVYVYDRDTGQTERISKTRYSKWVASDPSISDDGRFIAFESMNSYDPIFHRTYDEDILVYDRKKNRTIYVPIGLDPYDER